VQKRSNPSISFTTASGFSVQKGNDTTTACTAILAEMMSKDTSQITATVASGLTVGDASRFISNNNTTSTISISSEL
jgi:hypothetical protein